MSGIFGSVFGTPDLGSKGYKGSTVGSLANAGNILGDDRHVGDSEFGHYEEDNPLYRQSAHELADMYGHAPTSQDQAAALAQMNAGATSHYSRARSQLMADAANRGIDTSGDMGNESSTLGGGLSSIENNYANTIGGNRNQYYADNLSPAAQQRRKLAQMGIYHDLADSEFTKGTNSRNTAANGYMNLAGQYNTLAQQTAQQEAQGGLGNVLGSVLGTVGQIYGMGGFGKALGGAVSGGGGGTGDLLSSLAPGISYDPGTMNYVNVPGADPTQVLNGGSTVPDMNYGTTPDSWYGSMFK